jgi:hypothetical protein
VKKQFVPLPREIVLFLTFACLSSPSAAATRFFINCIPSPIPPAAAACFNEHIGKPFTFYVVALSQLFVADTGYTGTVHITSSDPTAALPADYVFKASDAGIAPFVMTFHSVTSTYVPSVETVTAVDTVDSIQGIGNFVVYPAASAIATIPTLSFSSRLLMFASLIFTTWLFRVVTRTD